MARESTSPVALLRAAEAAIARTDYKGAVEQLLAAWRVCRASELSQLIERLSAEPGVGGLDLTGLLDGSSKLIVGRVAAFKQPDPRVSACFARFVTEIPKRPNSMGKVWTQCHHYLRKHADARALAIAAAKLGTVAAQVSAPSFGARLERQLQVTVETMRADARAHEQLDQAAAELVARLSAALESGPSKRGAELLAAIHQDPHDLALRQVYADLLIERGDVRGEFINLQLGPEQRSRTREHELLAEHDVEWAGDVGRAFLRSTWVFERGFLVAGRCRRSLSDRFFADPGWALIERVQNMPADFIEALELPSLRLLSGENCGAVFQRERPLPMLERLASSWWSVDERTIAVLERGELLPNLRELDLGYKVANIEHLARLFEGPFAKRLTRLELTPAIGASVVTIRAFVLDRGAPLQVLVLRAGGYELEFHAVDEARLAGLRVRIDRYEQDIAWLRDELARLAKHRWRVRSVEVTEKLREPLREVLTSFE